MSCTRLRIRLNTICGKPGFNSLKTPLNHGASYTKDASKETETTQQRNLSNASQDRQAAQKEHFAVMQFETASTTRQPRGEHRGTTKGLQDCGRHYVTRTIHSPHRVTDSGVFKGRRARHLPGAPFFGDPPLRCHTHKFSLLYEKHHIHSYTVLQSRS